MLMTIAPTFECLLNDQFDDPNYVLHDGFLYYGNRICIPQTSLCDFLICELHVGGAANHHDREHMTYLVSDRFYWPRLANDVARVV